MAIEPIERVYTNHLPTELVRASAMQARKTAVVDWPLPEPILFAATDNRKAPPDPATASAGNMTTWQRMLGECVDAGIKSVLVLEDDILFVPEFKSRFVEVFADLPEEWDFFALGARIWGGIATATRVSPRLVQAGAIAGTYALAARGAAIEGLLAHLAKREQRSLGTTVRSYMWTNNSRVYVAAPPLVGHAAGPSTVWGHYPTDNWWPIDK